MITELLDTESEQKRIWHRIGFLHVIGKDYSKMDL